MVITSLQNFIYTSWASINGSGDTQVLQQNCTPARKLWFGRALTAGALALLP